MYLFNEMGWPGKKLNVLPILINLVNSNISEMERLKKPGHFQFSSQQDSF